MNIINSIFYKKLSGKLSDLAFTIFALRGKKMKKNYILHVLLPTFISQDVHTTLNLFLLVCVNKVSYKAPGRPLLAHLS